MWISPVVAIAILGNSVALISAWTIDKESCSPDSRIQNLRGVVEYIMQWPAVVDRNLGHDKHVNEYTEKLFREADWGKVKSIINAVGKMSKEDTSDTMDPIIYCNFGRLEKTESETDPSKHAYMDLTHEMVLEDDHADNVDACKDPSSAMMALTQNWEDDDGKKRAYIQLCSGFLKDVGQIRLFDANHNFEVKKLRVATNMMLQMGKGPLHIDDLAPLPATIFHEFVHTWKVQEPQIDDHGLYGWDDLTTMKDPKLALDVADSFAFVAIGTWVISKFGATISDDGEVHWDNEDELARRDRQVGISWFA